MKIKMLKNKAGTGNAIGSVCITYEAGVTYEMNDVWAKNLADKYIANGDAEEIKAIEKKIVKPTQTKVQKKEVKTKIKSDKD
jgi:hypothetical protein